MSRFMDWMPTEPPTLGERIDRLWKRGVRLAACAAIAFGLSTAAAIAVGAALTGSAFAQIVVTVLAALAFWMPFFFIVLRVERWLDARGRRGGGAPAETAPAPDSRDDQVWRRLFAAAPEQSQRIGAIRRSLERSRRSLGCAPLDPDAHELCIMIDRRLPELIHHELEILPPDDRNRRRSVGELIDLIEQFARHCSSRGEGGAVAEFEAEVLRRRFQARLTEF